MGFVLVSSLFVANVASFIVFVVEGNLCLAALSFAGAYITSVGLKRVLQRY